MWSFIQLLFGAYVGGPAKTIFALLGAVLFSGYIIFDTENLIARHDLDDYIMASVALYLVRAICHEHCSCAVLQTVKVSDDDCQ
jgi:hypothetical protein